MDILIGTNNQFKQKEMLWHLEGLPDLQLHFLAELPTQIKVEEDGQTLLENAVKKALAISKQTNYYVLTSDAGVDIPGLKEQWQLTKPQRMVGEDKTDQQKAETLLQKMQGLSGEERKCIFHLALALAKNGQLLWSEESLGEEGYIAEQLPTEPIGQSLWMGAMWFYPDLDKRDSELTQEQRSEIRVKYQTPMKQRLQQFILTLVRS